MGQYPSPRGGRSLGPLWAPNAILLCLTRIKTFSTHKVLYRNGMRTTLTALLLHDGNAFFVYGIEYSFPPKNRPLIYPLASCFSAVLWPSSPTTCTPYVFSSHDYETIRPAGHAYIHGSIPPYCWSSGLPSMKCTCALFVSGFRRLLR